MPLIDHLQRCCTPLVFKPERFLDGGLERLPPNSYKPFGSGERACIGRAFAIQEATLVVGGGRVRRAGRGVPLTRWAWP